VAVHAANGRFGMFKPMFDKYSIIELFHPDHPEITDNKVERFRGFFSNIPGMFKRNSVKPKYGATHIIWREPIWDRLQSSNEDVEAELTLMREHPAHSGSVLMLAGGDGLTEMRMEHALARDPRKWVFSMPMVLPVRGEMPHGTAHTLHGYWRLWLKWVKILARACDQTEYIQDDWGVSDLKQHEHCIFILTAGVTKFIDLVFKGSPTPPAMVQPLLGACAPNRDASYCAHFLYDFGFLYLQQRHAVRDKNVEQLDLIWRETLGCFNTREGHKTQYAPMNITHVYRQEALLPEIRAVVDEMRSLALSDLESSMVGWDMPAEKINNVLRSTVQLPYKELIAKKIETYNFTSPVSQSFESVMRHNRKAAKPQAMRDISRSVDALVNFLYAKLIYRNGQGPLQKPHWEVLTEPRANSLLGSELLGKTPWVKAHEALLPPPHTGKESFREFARRHLDIRVTW
jgi:hypothetical protein